MNRRLFLTRGGTVLPASNVHAVLRSAIVLTAVLALLATQFGAAARADSHLDPIVRLDAESLALDAGWGPDRKAPSAIDVQTATALTFTVDGDADDNTHKRTEGFKAPASGGGDFGRRVEVDLHLAADWATKAVRAGLWVVGEKADVAGRDNWFGIIEFANLECPADSDCSSATSNLRDYSGFRIWDSNIGWSDYLTGFPFTYGETVRLAIELDPYAEQYRYFINGIEVGTAQAGAGTTQLREVFLNAYNFSKETLDGLTTDAAYSVAWSDMTVASPVAHGTLQAAIDAAGDGDTILVNGGDHQPLRTHATGANPLTIKAVAGTRPVLDGDAASTGRVVDLRGSGTRLQGFAITGQADHVGVSISGQDVSVVDNVITGGLTGIQTTTANPDSYTTLHDNVISGVEYGISLQTRGNILQWNEVSATVKALGVGNWKDETIAVGDNLIEYNQFTSTGTLLAAAEYDTQVDASNNWWGGTPTASRFEGSIDYTPWCTDHTCSATTSTPPVTAPPVNPPVTPDTPPAAPPVIVPPRPSTPPVPIVTPPGQPVNRPPGQSGAVVGGQPVPTTTNQVPAVPPPSQRTPQQVQQVQQAANQVVGSVTGNLPASTPPPVTVTNTDTGATVTGLLAGSDGTPTPVPAEGVVAVSAGGAGMVVAGADGNGSPTGLTDAGAVSAPQGGMVGAVASGFTPSSSGQVVLFSDPVVLGEFTTDADGLFKGQVTIPDWVPAGDHTLVVAGEGAEGQVALMLGITVEGEAAFSDVAPSSTHATAIARLKALDITSGYADGTYGPSGDITRGQMAAFLARALDLDTDVETDLVDAVGAHGEAIAAVVAAGVASGYDDGTFRPGGTVTRGQMATFLANAAGLEPVGTSKVSDAVGAHAAPIDAVIEAGLASGYPDGTFRPSEPVTRAQMATFVINLVDHLDS